MESYPVFGAMPPASLFTFPPLSHPATLPPPAPGSHPHAPPFAIPHSIYAAALDPRVPITIASLYAVTAKALNAYNKSTGKRPWAISKTKLFHGFVVFHNVFLAVYSAWTFWGMLGALRRSMVNPAGPTGLAGLVDSVCRLQGPAGLGKSVFYSEEANRWETFADDVVLAADGAPTGADEGRIWNEGLAFYGWIFYLSKFYEVLDTFIILAKGKLSSTLQTYHHAGAMMCMWAGMRYMSAPIWMFAFVNAGIHAMMYTYYTITAFSIRVPMIIKRSLTSLQITQFLVGASYAMAHSFVTYTIPVTVSMLAETVAAPSATGEAAVPTASSTLDGLKKLIFGAESNASYGAAHGGSTAPSAIHNEVHTFRQSVPCITTSGETFAIWLNVLYLAPLTYLFASFFVASYVRRSNAESSKTKTTRKLSNVVLAEKAGWDAARGIEREVYGQGNEEAVVSDEDEADTSAVTANGKVAANGKGSERVKGKANGKLNGKTRR